MKPIHTRRQLRKHNKAVVKATPLRAALTDRKVRALLPTLTTPEVATKVESTLRQSRRDHTAYNRAHVHVGAEPQPDYAPKGLAPADKRVRAELAKAARADAKPLSLAASAQRAEQSKAVTAAAAGSAVISFGDTRGGGNAADSEGAAASSSETIPFAGPRFKQTERAAVMKARSAERWAAEYDIQAWPDFEDAHPTEAGYIATVWAYGAVALGEDKKANLAEWKLYARMLDSWLKQQRAPARDKLRALREEAWREWVKFRTRWRRGHPDILPSTFESREHWRPSHQSGALPATLRERVAVVAAAAAEPRNTAQMDHDAQHGLSLRPGSMFYRLPPLAEAIRRAVARVEPEWSGPEERYYMRVRAAEAGAAADWWRMWWYYQPVSLLDPPKKPL